MGKNGYRLKAIINTALSQLYEADETLEPELMGLTYREVLVLRLLDQAAQGDVSAIEKIFDRVDGKPTQVNENLNVNGNYVEYLELLRQEDTPDPEDVITYDIEDLDLSGDPQPPTE